MEYARGDWNVSATIQLPFGKPRRCPARRPCWWCCTTACEKGLPSAIRCRLPSSQFGVATDHILKPFPTAKDPALTSSDPEGGFSLAATPADDIAFESDCQGVSLRGLPIVRPFSASHWGDCLGACTWQAPSTVLGPRHEEDVTSLEVTRVPLVLEVLGSGTIC